MSSDLVHCGEAGVLHAGPHTQRPDCHQPEPARELDPTATMTAASFRVLMAQDEMRAKRRGIVDAAKSALPLDSAARKNIPMARGLLDYFPAALAAVAEVSRLGNEKHNPGQPMHHARGKSSDHADCVIRHLADRGSLDPEDGQRHSAKVAWRALALLQEELEAEGAPLARAAWLDDGVQR